MPKSPAAWLVIAVVVATIAPALISLIASLAPWVLGGAAVAGALRVLWFYTRR